MESLSRQFNPAHRGFLRKLAEACRRAGGKALLVGGCVRSALLGETVEDFDLEVFGLEAARLEPVLRKLAPVTLVGKSFGVYKLSGWPVDVGLPRRERQTGTGHRDFAVTVDPGLSLEGAARRRDFTLNAIYYDILEEELLDPMGGLTDLKERRLRHCSGKFSEDPLRVLRAMQFAARIPARVDPETVTLCTGMNPHSLSRERFFGEWEKLLLAGKQPSAGLEFLRQCGWVRYFPELEALIDCAQDPSWHPEGDVWVHTLHCLDAFAGLRTGHREEDLVVGLAVLCHDFGKPLTTEIRDGKIRSPGHESAGLEPTRTFLARLNVPKRITEQVLPLVKCHMRPAMLYRDRSSPGALRRLARDCGRMDLLMRVFRADSAGRPGHPDKSGEIMAWLQEESRRLEISRSRPKPVLMGRHLLERGWKAGPELGTVLDAAYEAQLDGHFDSLEGALQWLEDQGSGELPATQPGSPKS